MKTSVTKISLVASALLAFASFLPSIVRAEDPGQHPAYLHALQDLREARAHLDRGHRDAAVKWDEHSAVNEIDAAINEIKKAAIDDGKNLADHPPVDPTWIYGRRLRRSLELLRDAGREVKEKEDDAFAHGLRHRALEHIDLAAKYIEQGMAGIPGL